MFAHIQEPVVTERSSRGSLRGRGGGVERYRGQGDWKVRHSIDLGLLVWLRNTSLSVVYHSAMSKLVVRFLNEHLNCFHRK